MYNPQWHKTKFIYLVLTLLNKTIFSFHACICACVHTHVCVCVLMCVLSLFRQSFSGSSGTLHPPNPVNKVLWLQACTITHGQYIALMKGTLDWDEVQSVRLLVSQRIPEKVMSQGKKRCKWWKQKTTLNTK